mmetsp:Transcript_3299/g.4398  ORF Transcript_3299/g.4398 Transcript_3299/m.4398 type:complete len:361 (-) Transcript_3299:227-1309(-)
MFHKLVFVVFIAIISQSQWIMTEADLNQVVMMEPNNYENINAVVQSFEGLGKEVIQKSKNDWNLMTEEDFRSYDAIIVINSDFVPNPFHDPFSNAQSWGPAMQDGNVIIMGTADIENLLVQQVTAKFTVSAIDGKPSGYISLGLSENINPPSNYGDFLNDAFGVSGNEGFEIGRNILQTTLMTADHIVANDPVLDELTDELFQNWKSSMTIFKKWPTDILNVYSIAMHTTDSVMMPLYQASDGTEGTPYILAKGLQVCLVNEACPESVIDTTHSPAPTLSPSHTSCTNEPDWVLNSETDDEFRCSYLLEATTSVCNLLRYLSTSNDKSVEEACCVCGGGEHVTNKSRKGGKGKKRRKTLR